MRGCAACLAGTNKVRPRGERKSPRNIIGYLFIFSAQSTSPSSNQKPLFIFSLFPLRKFVGARGGKVDNMLTFLWSWLLGTRRPDTAMFYKEVHPPASHKACAPPFATHKASSQGGIISTDPYHLKLNLPTDESSNRIDSTIHRFTGSTISIPRFTGSTLPRSMVVGRIWSSVFGHPSFPKGLQPGQTISLWFTV
jgi:hypothetical protein